MENYSERQRQNSGKAVPAVVRNYVPTRLLENARRLRKEQTKAENFLWELLKNRQLQGLKFRRQHPINHEGIILDFFCVKARVALELDGIGHQEKRQKLYDEDRTKRLHQYGIQVLRFTNAEVIDDTVHVLSKILKACNQTP